MPCLKHICIRRAIFLRNVFRFFLGIICVFQGGWLFGFLACVAFTWVFVAFVAFHFASSAFTVPLFRILHCQFRWLFALLSQLVSGLGFLHAPRHPPFD